MVLDQATEQRLLEMKAALREKGVSITPRRAKLLEVLVNSETHPTVGEIHDGVRRYFPSTSLATIYNTIELLKETGQVLELEFSGASNRYDGRRPHSHAHVVCLRCERIDDMDSTDDSGESFEEVSSATGYQVVRRRVDYYGVCPSCLARLASH
jgi:Fur family peroxide stress response transcriptional regulator